MIPLKRFFYLFKKKKISLCQVLFEVVAYIKIVRLFWFVSRIFGGVGTPQGVKRHRLARVFLNHNDQYKYLSGTGGSRSRELPVRKVYIVNLHFIFTIILKWKNLSILHPNVRMKTTVEKKNTNVNSENTTKVYFDFSFSYIKTYKRPKCVFCLKILAAHSMVLNKL